MLDEFLKSLSHAPGVIGSVDPALDKPPEDHMTGQTAVGMVENVFEPACDSNEGATEPVPVDQAQSGSLMNSLPLTRAMSPSALPQDSGNTLDVMGLRKLLPLFDSEIALNDGRRALLWGVTARGVIVTMPGTSALIAIDAEEIEM